MLRFFAVAVAFFVVACSQSDDGPIPLYPDSMSGTRDGYLLRARLDSGRVVHLRSDTLAVELDSIWTLANCFLKELSLTNSADDTILNLNPKVLLEINDKDCATPLYRPDTNLYLEPRDEWKKYREIRVYDSDGELEDSIALRSGKYVNDSLEIYIDSTFADFYELPRRTAGTPAIMRTVDSLKERTFYWRALPAKCAYVIDTCETVADTVYPSSWSKLDTNLVLLRKECADTTLRYCLNRDWEYDTAKVGAVQERLDTLWYTTWYLKFKVPKCGVVNRAKYGNTAIRAYFRATQEIFDPESDGECYSDISSEYSVMRLDSGTILQNPDSILAIFDTATVGRDTL